MMLVTVEVSQGIVQIVECGSGVASVLSKVNEVEECTHRFHDPGGDIRVASNYREENALQIFCFLPSVLSVPSEPISKMAKADARLQNRQPPVKFFVAEPRFRPLDGMVHEELVPLMQSIGRKEQGWI